MSQLLSIERRRVSRVQPTQEHRVAADVSLPVRVLELGRAGVLLESKAELAVGDRAELIVTIGDRSVHVAIEIRHASIEANPRGGPRWKAGAAFVKVTTEQSLLLDQLLGAGQR